jgi:NADH dehydrogenase (ubiquinone) Fe-S protein 1
MNENLIVYINNNKYDIDKDNLNTLNIIDFCVLKGYVIPRFCYHSQLSIAGNCRMCLVEISDSIKPIVSCAMLLRPSIKIFTNTSLIKKARENVLEFLLINHPLDCPICDQGGECDLQDQTLLFGNDRGRFYELKKVSFDKNCNLFIKTIMTRCIHCTRCIRFLNDLNLNFELGMLGRGYNMEIGNYIENNINSELASNIIDLCPVGALTSKIYAFKARPWELINFKSFDILDTISSTITISLQGTKILRILPYNNDDINNVWLTDKARYFFDSFYLQRIANPYKFSKVYNKFIIVNWYNFYKFIFFFKKNVNFLKNVNFFLNLNFLSLNDLIFFKSLDNKNLNLIDFQLNNIKLIDKKFLYESAKK